VAAKEGAEQEQSGAVGLVNLGLGCRFVVDGYGFGLQMYGSLEKVICPMGLKNGKAPSRNGENLVHQIRGFQGTLEQELGGKVVHLDVQFRGVFLKDEADEELHVVQVDLGGTLARVLRWSWACGGDVWQGNTGNGGHIVRRVGSHGSGQSC
jgi:hypothetical protein